MKENLYTPRSIRTVSGRYIDLFDPDPATFDIEDIAHALSNIPRFGGHLPYFYSVAQHSIAVAAMLPPEHAYQGLMHDASEAYLLDIPKPLKDLLPEYQVLEARMMERLADRFTFHWPLHERVKMADEVALEQEWHHRMLRPRLTDRSAHAATVSAEFIELFLQLNPQR